MSGCVSSSRKLRTALRLVWLLTHLDPENLPEASPEFTWLYLPSFSAGDELEDPG